MKTNKRQQQKTGSALLTVMVIITIISLTAGSFYIFAASMAQHSRQMTESIRAQAIAEAGAHLAYSRLRQNYAWTPGSDTATSLNDGSFEIHIVSREHHQRRVISVGTYGSAQSIVGIDLFDANRPPPHVLGMVPGDPTQGDSVSSEMPEEFMYWASLNYALFANGELTLNGAPTVDGHMHANWELTMNGNDNNFVAGSLASGNPIDDRIGESFRAHWRKVPFPLLTDPEFQAFLAEADAAGKLTRWDEDRIYHRDADFSGIYVIDGDLTFRGSGTRTVDGLLYVTGDITANGAPTVHGTIMAGGDITFNGASGVHNHRYIDTYGPVGRDAVASAIEVGPVNISVAQDSMHHSDSNPQIRIAGWWQGTLDDIPGSSGVNMDNER